MFSTQVGGPSASRPIGAKSARTPHHPSHSLVDQADRPEGIRPDRCALWFPNIDKATKRRTSGQFDALGQPPDLTTTAIPGTPGFGILDGFISNDDFFYYLTIFAAGC